MLADPEPLRYYLNNLMSELPDYQFLGTSPVSIEVGVSFQPNILGKIKGCVDDMLEQGADFARLSSLIALAGLLSWCPRCGEWQGEGSEGIGPNIPSPQAPPMPKRLLRSLAGPLLDEPTPTSELPPRDGNKLTPNSGILESLGEHDGQDAKFRHRPPSTAHGRIVDTLYGGSPRPDSYPHGHEVTFVRGDAEEILVYDRLKDGTIVHETDTDVVYLSDSNAYEWKPKR